MANDSETMREGDAPCSCGHAIEASHESGKFGRGACRECLCTEASLEVSPPLFIGKATRF